MAVLGALVLHKHILLKDVFPTVFVTWDCLSLFKTVILDRLNPFPNKPWLLRVGSTSLLKTMWEKEKLLVTSNFSYSHSVF